METVCPCGKGVPWRRQDKTDDAKDYLNRSVKQNTTSFNLQRAVTITGKCPEATKKDPR